MPAPLKLFCQEYVPDTWVMANMNMVIHDMEGQIEIGDTFKNPKFRNKGGKLRTFDRIVANPMWNQDWCTEADYDNDELDRFPAGAGFPGKSSGDCPSLRSRSAGSLRCAPNSKTADSAWQWGWVQHMHASPNDKGRTANQNVFYNTTAPGIVLFLNRAKPEKGQGAALLVNVSQVFEKGDPKNFIPDEGIRRIADALIGWKEEEKLSRIVDHAELKQNDYNISPSRYIHPSDAETYRPIPEIVAELEMIEKEAEETDKALRKILKQMGI